MTRYIFDTWQNVTPHIPDLLRAFPQGVDVIRYVCRAPTGSWKTIKTAEARAIAATNGKIRLGIVSELVAQTFGADAGRADGQWAAEQCGLFGVPQNFFLAYASDADYPRNRIGAHGAAFQAFFTATLHLKPQRWCYGAGDTCDYLERMGFIDSDGTWLTQSNGFSGTTRALNSGDWDMHQKLPAKLFGMDIDPNVLRDPARDAGFFIPRVAPPPLPDAVFPATASHADVEALQLALNSVDHAELTVDGVYGRATMNAVTEYQQSKGLAADGVAGPDTIRTIKAT